MNAPLQAPPVSRGHTRAVQTGAVSQQGCNWFRCAGVAITCAVACIDTLGVACAACLGSSYESCKDCF
jgi:hypothetical protein